tara:strand:+ start:587 stop:796 length:210 start_codon:yes stop_codon:yes gene_type:complete
MKKKTRRYYEVFNMENCEWEKQLMTDEQYKELNDNLNSDVEEISAEYDIITRIISQRIGVTTPRKKSMD